MLSKDIVMLEHFNRSRVNVSNNSRSLHNSLYPHLLLPPIHPLLGFLRHSAAWLIAQLPITAGHEKKIKEAWPRLEHQVSRS